MQDYQTYKYPKSRLATFDVGKIGINKHHVAGFLEIDVTLAKQRVKQQQQSGTNVGFTAWLLKIIGDTIAQHPHIHAINHHRRMQIGFDDVDISMPVERDVAGVKVPLAMLIRSANKKSVADIQTEIQAAISTPVGSEKDFVLDKKRNNRLDAVFFNLPQWLRMLVWRRLLANPFTRKRNMGTVIVTNVGSAARFPGWVLPKSLHNLCFGIGSVVEKPWVHEHKIEIRQILYLTILFDHDVIDGAPAARFAEQLLANIEAAKEL